MEELKNQIENKKNVLEKYQYNLIALSKDENGRNSIVRKYLSELDNSKNQTPEVLILQWNDFPAYFNAIETESFIIASNAREHPVTNDLSEYYLNPSHVFSILDCPIIIDKAVIGVICCENQHGIINWNTEDCLFLQSLTGIISLSYKN